MRLDGIFVRYGAYVYESSCGRVMGAVLQLSIPLSSDLIICSFRCEKFHPVFDPSAGGGGNLPFFPDSGLYRVFQRM